VIVGPVKDVKQLAGDRGICRKSLIHITLQILMKKTSQEIGSRMVVPIVPPPRKKHLPLSTGWLGIAIVLQLSARALAGGDYVDVKEEGNGVKAALALREHYSWLTQGLRIQMRISQRLDRGAPFGEQLPDVILTDTVVSDCWGRPAPLAECLSLDEEALIQVAGDIHAEDCANLLLNRITFRQPAGLLSARRREYRQNCPAFDSLVRLGERSCQEGIKRIALEPDSLTRVFIVGLLQTCMGDSETRSRLGVIAAETLDKDQCTRLAAAIAQVDDGPVPKNLRQYHNERWGGIK
jgi:hypothetical protein